MSYNLWDATSTNSLCLGGGLPSPRCVRPCPKIPSQAAPRKSTNLSEDCSGQFYPGFLSGISFPGGLCSTGSRLPPKPYRPQLIKVRASSEFFTWFPSTEDSWSALSSSTCPTRVALLAVIRYRWHSSQNCRGTQATPPRQGESSWGDSDLT